MPKRPIDWVITMTFILFSVQITSAQMEEEKFYYGFYAGASSSIISEVRSTLIRPIFPVDTYSTQDDRLLGFVAGATIHYRFEKSKFAIQPEVNFSSQGGIFHYEDVSELSYDLSFKYSYLNVTPLVKFYMVHGLYATIGPQLGIVIDQSNLEYISNQPELGPDLQIEQSLKEVLKGNNNVAMSMGVGYDAPFGLNVNVRWNYGVSDAIETLANGFYFIENKNPSNNFQVTLGYHIPFFKD